ncbi:MAG: AbrB/MazE/SpoVT family DNA-binding domain-containing protein [Candidatus Gracilibacteria bacterium]|nr:AbrB/MazE/SpoVT family DNA-binding domain-containing protein [Candidatus Gracilibacteria bacterium]
MKKNFCDIKLLGTVTIGPKGQIVIPKEIRDKLALESGDSMSVLLKDDKFIGLVRNKDLNELMEFVNSEKNKN